MGAGEGEDTGMTDTERLDWIGRYWDSQATSPQELRIPHLENPTGSFRDAIDTAMMITEMATRKALKESIEHWERLSTGHRMPDEAPNTSSCALCKLFYKRVPFYAAPALCDGCPVKEFTGESGCHSTPCKEAVSAWMEWGGDSVQFRDEAKKELEFLRRIADLWGKK